MRMSDWSSDVCSSDLPHQAPARPAERASSTGFRADDSPPFPWLDGPDGRGCALPSPGPRPRRRGDRKSVVEGKRVSVRVELGGRRLINTNSNRAELIPWGMVDKTLLLNNMMLH